MKKFDLVTRVATQASRSKPVADAAVNAVFSAIGDALAGDETVTPVGLGTLSARTRSARQRTLE